MLTSILDVVQRWLGNLHICVESEMNLPYFSMWSVLLLLFCESQICCNFITKLNVVARQLKIWVLSWLWHFNNRLLIIYLTIGLRLISETGDCKGINGCNHCWER